MKFVFQPKNLHVICSTNQRTGFYTIGILVVKGLNNSPEGSMKNLHVICFPNTLKLKNFKKIRLGFHYSKSFLGLWRRMRKCKSLFHLIYLFFGLLSFENSCWICLAEFKVSECKKQIDQHTI